MRPNHKRSLGGIEYILLCLVSLFGIRPIAAQSIAEPIQTIIVSGMAEVYFTYGEQREITKEISGNQIPEVIVDFKDGTLTVTTLGKAQGEVVKVYVSGLSLKTILADDRAQFHDKNTISSEVLKITSSDHGSVDLAVDSNEVHLFMDGGDINISGFTNTRFVKMNESRTYGTLDSSNLIVKGL